MRGRLRAALGPGLAGTAAALVGFGPHPAAAAIQEAWPAFALATGLLFIGRIAADDYVLAAAGSWIARIGGGRTTMLVASLGLVAMVTAVLNLDTAVVFLTPVLIHCARTRGLNERVFIYGTVLMSNSASLLLVGSNLTNLLVLGGTHVSSFDFARAMFVPWLVAILGTSLVLWTVQRGQPVAAFTKQPAVLRMRGRAGLIAVAGAGVLLIALPDPALPVLLLAIVVTAWRRLHGRLAGASLARTTPIGLMVLFVLTVCVATVSRISLGPHGLVPSAGRTESLLLGAVGAIAINNLPAASLLSSHPMAHPLFLLLGLNLGPNLVITGSLSAVLWRRVAREEGASISISTYTRLGLLVTPLTLATAALTLALLYPAA